MKLISKKQIEYIKAIELFTNYIFKGQSNMEAHNFIFKHETEFHLIRRCKPIITTNLIDEVVNELTESWRLICNQY